MRRQTMNGVQTANGSRLPYDRYDVLQRPPEGAAVPRRFDVIPLVVWQDFWSKIGEAAEEMNRGKCVVYMICLAIYVLIPLLVFSMPQSICEAFGITFVVKFIIFSVLYAVLIGCIKYWSDWKKKKLKKVCQESSFASYGIGLDCISELPSQLGTGGWHIYLYPPISSRGMALEKVSSTNSNICAQHGYFRVEVMKDEMFKFITPSLPYYDYLPSGLESIPLNKWTSFWTRIDDLSRESVKARRARYVLPALYLLTLSYDELGDRTNPVLLALMIATGYYLYRFHKIFEILPRIEQEYAHVFEQHGVYMEVRRGVYMEMRRESQWTMCVNWQEFVYFFPLKHV